ncbi:hypothetical protein [Thermaurantiacus sp.]
MGRPLLLPLLASLLLPACLAAKVATAPVKVVGKAAGTVVETGWDAATTTAEEAEEDRLRAERRERARHGGAEGPAPD